MSGAGGAALTPPRPLAQTGAGSRSQKDSRVCLPFRQPESVLDDAGATAWIVTPA